MTSAPVVSDGEVLLVGPAPIERPDFDFAVERVTHVVAADGGAQKALQFNRVPDLVIGDFDSFSPDARLPESRLLRIAEQDSTDFEKCLDRIEARRILALGFLGLRQDHTLAALSALAARSPGLCILVGSHDVIVHAPARLRLDLAADTRVSLFPMAEVTGRSSGLHWPIDGLGFSPSGRIGTSNRATGPVHLEFDGPGMLLILPRSALETLLAALDG